MKKTQNKGYYGVQSYSRSSYGIKIRTGLTSVLSQFTRLTDGETDRRTAFSSLYRVCISCSAVKCECSADFRIATPPRTAVREWARPAARHTWSAFVPAPYGLSIGTNLDDLYHTVAEKPSDGQLSWPSVPMSVLF